MDPTEYESFLLYLMMETVPGTMCFDETQDGGQYAKY
jgi:hypothetical protein